ncbi:hypothetical protein PybrP1_011350 [[Pythium] brassicae (nom. inval.)]|nr:hypothetical protein PybrP1_011350 [[Pythium] brassicae (nom. inval.)]
MGNSESRDPSAAAASAPTRSSMPARSADASARAASDPALRSASLSDESVRPTAVEAGGIERGQQAAEDAAGQLSYWYLVKHGYNELVHLIIRPPRAQYALEDLGPARFAFGSAQFERRDFEVVNERQQTLRCSHWLPVAPSDSTRTKSGGSDGSDPQELPCVIYLHGNSSCRVEALSVLRTCLASGLTVVAFDCAGSGQSDGEYISLGYYEREDLKAVVAHLRASRVVGAVGLWGRSMGAATALLHADRDPSIAGIVVDSAFTSLEQLVQEIVERGRREGYTIPGFAVKIVMKFIRASVQKRAGFDLRRLSPLAHAAESFVPALFVAATGDEFIAPHHSDQLYAQYAGDKNVVKVKGDHNTVRPQFLLDSAGIFLQTALQVDPRLAPQGVPPPPARGRSRTPWASTSTASAPWGMRMSDLDAAFADRRDSRAASRAAPKHDWVCKQCTFVNQPLRPKCEICRSLYALSDDDVTEKASRGALRRNSSTSTSSSKAQASDGDNDGDGGSAVDARSVALAVLVDDAPPGMPARVRTM